MQKTIISICLILAFAGIADAKGRKHRKLSPRPPIISTPEKVQLLRSFTDEQIKAELAHRLLTLYTLEELQAESDKREKVKQ